MAPSPDEIAEALFEKAMTRDPSTIGRAISALEGDDAIARALCRSVWGHRRPGAIGFTGPPGAGKSSLLSALVRHIRGQGATVAVLAVDPSSPLTGGSILGDRFRMREHVLDPGVYIRSMASGGASGGLARAAADAVALLSSTHEWVLLESVGVGQADVAIRSAVDTTVLVLNPGTGDVVQSLKAGILEVADLFVINKADRDGAAALQGDIESLVEAVPGRGSWKPPVVATAATLDRGLDLLLAELSRRRGFVETPATRAARDRQQFAAVSNALAVEMLRDALDRLTATPEWSGFAHAPSPRDGARAMIGHLIETGIPDDRV